MRHAGADVLAISGVLGEFLERTHAMTINQWHNHRASYNVYTISELSGSTFLEEMEGVVNPTLFFVLLRLAFHFFFSTNISCGLFLEGYCQLKHPVIHAVLYPVLLGKLH
jgi:hypothetical protein